MHSYSGCTARRCAWLLAAALLAGGGGVAAQPSPEAGRLPLRWHSPRRYRASAQNWAVAQRPDGIVHVGNNSGVLEFDGVSWRVITSPRAAAARSLAVGADGTVWVGCVGDFGYLAVDAAGHSRYVSLLPHVPAEDRSFSDVWKTHATPAGVYFQSSERLFRWAAGELRVWRPEPPLHFSFVVGDTLYLRQKGVGLMRLQGDTLQLLPGGERFAEQRIYALLPGPGGELLLAVRESGLWRQRGDDFQRLHTPASHSAQAAQVYHGATLPGGGYALATLGRGLLLLDEGANLVSVVDQGGGLNDDNVKYVHPDHQGGLWMGLERGVARLELASALSAFDDRDGLQGTVHDLLRHGPTLYAATARGVYALRPADGRGGARFEALPGVRTQVWALARSGDVLLAATNAGLYALGPEGARLLDERPATALMAAPGRSELIVGLRNGLLVARLRAGEQGPELVATPVVAVREWVRSVAVDSDGAVWASVLPSGLVRVALGGAPGELGEVRRFGPAEGLGEGMTIAFNTSGGAVFGTSAGLRRFAVAEQRFVPFTPGGQESEAWRKDVSALAEDARGNLWLRAGPVGEPEVGVALRASDGSFKWQQRDMQRVPGAYCILAEAGVDGGGAVWFGGARGVTRLALKRRPVPLAPRFSALVRAALVLPSEEPLVHALARRGLSPAEGGGGRRGLPSLPFDLASLRFEFAAPAFDDERLTRYRTRLDGFDEGWGRFSSQTHRELTNLPAGEYVFRVQARDVHGRRSAPGSLAFSVHPPWYQTVWARAGLGLGILLLLGLGVHARTLQLRRRNRELEREVLRRTQQIRRQNSEIREQADAIRLTNAENERLLLNILPAPIAERLRRGEQAIVDSFSAVTVLFADVVGFTRLSASMPPAQLVALLNELFSDIDALAVLHGVEKIKTIGDGYMAVAGLPEPRADHAQAAANMALDMLRGLRTFNARRGLTLGMRVGLHTGPVVAGVIGTGKFSYDLWGDTVNTASRMESHGVANRVNVSAATHEALRGAFPSTARAPIEVKGKGQMHTFLLGGDDDPLPASTPVPPSRCQDPTGS